MKKILMLIPVICFLVCLVWAVQAELQPAPVLPEPVMTEPVIQVPVTETEPTVPTETEPVTVPTRSPDALGPQRIALPVQFGEENFLETALLPVQDDDAPNHELQRYEPEQTEIRDGHILLTADRDGEDYISGKMVSSFSFRYGTVTFRINTMKNPGLFPAVWLLPADGSLFPEVDILEMIGGRPDELYGVLHYPVLGKNGMTHDTQYFMYPYPYPMDLPESYTLTFQWNEDSLVWYLGDRKLQTMIRNIPDIPMYFIVNLAVGGDWAGHPTGRSVFPATMDVEILDFQPKEIYTR